MTSYQSDFVWDVDVNINGTSFRGCFAAPLSFEEIVARLRAVSGQDPATDCDKASVEFVGTFNGQPFTLYDYKGDAVIHIGGFGALDVFGLTTALGVLVADAVPVSYTARLPYEYGGFFHGWPTPSGAPR